LSICLRIKSPHQTEWYSFVLSLAKPRCCITGPQGFERTVVFALDDDPAVIAERVRESLDEWGYMAPPARACWRSDIR